MQIDKNEKGFNVVQSQDDIDKQARKQRIKDAKAKDKSKITNSDIWQLLLDISDKLNDI